MKITLIQTDIRWESPEWNRINLENLILDLKDKTDLILLPEMFTTGFTMKSDEYAEFYPDVTSRWMEKMASQTGAAIAATLIIKDKDFFYNRLVFVNPQKKYYYYDKRHLFRMGEEDKYFKSGDKRIVIPYRLWNICPLICYDLRFPVWSRNSGDYDLLIYLANWPSSRKDVWLSLLKARALENQSYVIGLNRVGKDGNGIQYSGNSIVYSPRGEVLLDLKEKEHIKTVNIDIESLKKFREKFPVWKDSDNFEINT